MKNTLTVQYVTSMSFYLSLYTRLKKLTVSSRRSHVNELIPNTGMRAEVLVYIRECNNKKRKALEELESGRKDKLVRK